MFYPLRISGALYFTDFCKLNLIKPETPNPRGSNFGYAHIAISVGSEKKVLELTEAFRKEGISIIGETRTTGDGYFEAVIEDPEGNWIELSV